MLARKITRSNKTVGYAISFSVAELCIKETYKSYSGAVFDCHIDSITVKRKGFDDVRFNLELIEIYSTPTALDI